MTRIRPYTVKCPTCKAPAGTACYMSDESGWINADGTRPTEYHSVRVFAATPDKAPSDPDPRLDPQDDPANTRPDRPAVFPQGNAHDHQEDPW